MDDRDSEAFRVLYKAHYRTVCRYLAARADPDAVEDLAAETFLIAWRRQPELPEHIVPWLLNTAAKCLSNHRRARKRSEALVDCLSGLLAISSGDLDDAVARSAQRRALVTALAALNDRDRELLLLSYWDGLPSRAAGDVLGLNPVLFRARLYRASRRLRQMLIRALEREDRGFRVGQSPEALDISET